MKNKEQLQKLVETAKINAKVGGVKLRNEDIAKRMGITRTYLSDLLGEPGKDVTSKHVEDFKAHFKDELGGIIKPSGPSNELNRERALIRVLMQRVAKLESERLGIPVEKVLKELEQDTMIAWKDLENEG